MFRGVSFSELCNIINESKNEVILKKLHLLYGIAQEICKYLTVIFMTLTTSSKNKGTIKKF